MRKINGAGRVGVIALRDVIRGEIEEGWPLIAIYERHADHLTIGYRQFTLYVRRYITGRPARTLWLAIPPQVPAAASPSPPAVPKTPPPAAQPPTANPLTDPPGFVWNPNLTKEDLV